MTWVLCESITVGAKMNVNLRADKKTSNKNQKRKSLK